MVQIGINNHCGVGFRHPRPTESQRGAWIYSLRVRLPSGKGTLVRWRSLNCCPSVRWGVSLLFSSLGRSLVPPGQRLSGSGRLCFFEFNSNLAKPFAPELRTDLGKEFTFFFFFNMVAHQFD